MTDSLTYNFKSRDANASKKLEILSIHPDEQNHLLTKNFSLSLHPNFHWAPFTFSRLKYLQGHSHFLDSEILALTTSWYVQIINRTLLLSWYSYHPWATFTFLIFISSLSNFHFLDIHIIPEQLSLSWYSNLCRASDGGGRVDTGSVVGKQLSWGSWRGVQQQQQQWCRKIQQLPLWGMLIHNVHKVKNPQINCDPWTEGVYQGSYTLKEVCLAQNS